MKLKNIYTEGVRIDHTAFDDWKKKKLFENCLDRESQRGLSFSFLNNLAPEDAPIWRFPGFIPDVLVEGCIVFDRYICELDSDISQWEIAAFWWASVAIHENVSVVDLNYYLDVWTERFYSAVTFAPLIWERHENKGCPVDNKKETLQAWGYMSDLRHSNVDSENIPNELRTKAARFMLTRNYRVAPSNCQPWGPYWETWDKWNKLRQLRQELRDTYDRTEVKALKAEIKQLTSELESVEYVT